LYQTYTRNGPEPFFVPLGGQIIMRSYGTFEQPNPFAAYLNFALTMIASLLIGLVFERRASADAHWRGLVLVALITLPMIAAAFFFSLSRGAWLGFALAFVVMSALRSRRALLLFALLSLVGVGLLALGSLNVLPPAIAERIADIPTFFGLNLFDPRAVVLTNENFALVDRMAHWFTAWNMFADHPWLGVGIGNYGVVYPSYGLREWPFSLGHAHNFYLNMLAETGALGLLCYVLFVASTIGYAWWTVRRTHGTGRAIAMGVLGALVAVAAHNFFDNLYVHGMNMQFAILLGILPILKDRS
ncbi:MAG: O-antigen ligase family protein, partial [Chloroflexi bacterium]|nr:O-antigen ligase family protein [Chloroflexota bacterium]